MDNSQILVKAKTLQTLAIENKLTLSVAESCTGGMVTSAITAIAGSSEYFQGGIVSYSNEAKMKMLHVKRDTLEKYGAVSRETAIEMAQNCRQIHNTDMTIATTGIAGPSGATDTKPVGLVYIAVVSNNIVEVQKNVFRGDRRKVQADTTLAALEGVIRIIRTVCPKF